MGKVAGEGGGIQQRVRLEGTRQSFGW